MSEKKHEINYSLCVKAIQELSAELQDYWKTQIRILKTIKIINNKLDILQDRTSNLEQASIKTDRRIYYLEKMLGFSLE